MRTVLICCIMGAQVLTALLLMFLVFVGMNRAILQQSHELLAQRSEAVASEILKFFTPAVRVTELHRRILGIDTIEQKAPSIPEWELFGTLQTQSEISGAFFARPDGSFIHMMQPTGTSTFITETMASGRSDVEMVVRDNNFRPLNRSILPKNEYSPLVNDWDALTASPHDGVWTLEQSLNIFSAPGMVLTVPIHQEERLVGVIGVEIELQTLGSILGSGTRSRGDILTLLSEDGDVILHLDSLDPIIDTTMSDLIARGRLSPEIAGQMDAATTGETRASYIWMDMDGRQERVLTNLQRLDIGPGLSWIVGLTSPQSGLTGPLQQNQSFLIYISLFAMVLLCSLAFPLANYIRKPVVAFSQKSRSVSDEGQAAVAAPYSELEETGQMLANEISQRRAFQSAYRRTFEVSLRGMARINPTDMRLLQVNQKLSQLLATDGCALQMRGLDTLILGKGQDTLASFSEALTDDTEFTMEAEFRTGTGRAKWLRMSAILIRDHAGEPDHALAIFDDITDARSRETELQNLKRDAHRVWRINMMGEFAAGLAHELNQPLGALVHDVDTAQFILKEGEIDRHELNDILADIGNHTRRAGAIIRALRHMVEKDALSSKTFSLDDLLEQTFAIMDPEVHYHGVCLRKLNDTDVMIHASHSQITQVLINLIRNACEAISGGRIRDGTISISAQRSGSRVKLFVEDNGPGFPDHIKPFTQFASTNPAGMGLGLSICKSLIKANDGAISYAPVATGGTIFVIELNGEETHARTTGSVA